MYIYKALYNCSFNSKANFLIRLINLNLMIDQSHVEMYTAPFAGQLLS